jgi:hypothetical protein
MHDYFDPALDERRYLLPSMFPEPASENENSAVCLTGPGSEKPFLSIAANGLIDSHLSGPGCSNPVLPPSTPTPKTALTAARTSPTGRSNNSAATTATSPSPSGTSSITSTLSCTIPSTASVMPPTCAANCRASPWWARTLMPVILSEAKDPCNLRTSPVLLRSA